MSSMLAEKQWRLIPWNNLRSGNGGDARQVGDDLRMLLSASAGADTGSYQRLENMVESQGHLFQCAPAVVSVIVAAVADGSIPANSLGASLDVLGRILAGYTDQSEVALGNANLREQCHAEAMKGYWPLLRVASERDPFNAWQVAQAVLVALDKAHSKRILEPACQPAG